MYSIRHQTAEQVNMRKRIGRQEDKSIELLIVIARLIDAFCVLGKGSKKDVDDLLCVRPIESALTIINTVDILFYNIHI